MNTKRPLAPGFINNLDRYLLLNKPEVWTARTHLVLFYGSIFILLLAFIAFIVPDDPRKSSPAGYWIGFVSLLSFIGFIIWIIFLLRFNVFKRFGISSPLDRLKTFILYFISIGTLVLFSYVEPYIETVRANAAYTDEEVVNDINKINMGITQLEYDSLNHRWSTDTVHVVKENDKRDNESYPDAETSTTAITQPIPGHMFLNKEELNRRLQQLDSAHKINDSLYVFFNTPDYTFLYSYVTETKASVQPLSSRDIYDRLVKNYSPPANRAALQKEVNDVIGKYNLSVKNDDEYNNYHDQRTYYEKIQRNYFLNSVQNSIDNIMERKHRWSHHNMPAFIRLFLYFTLVFTLLVFAFRHSTAKTFFLSLLTCVVLSILTSLIMTFTRNFSNAFYDWIIFYFIVFFCITLTVFWSRKRNLIGGIALNIFTWLLPFIPLVFVANYYEDIYYSYQQVEELNNYRLHLLWAEIGGLVLLLAMIPTYLHKLYRRWYASPEE